MRSLLILCFNMVRKSEAAHYTGREKIPGWLKVVARNPGVAECGGVLRDWSPTKMPRDSTENQYQNKPFPVAPASRRYLCKVQESPARCRRY